MSHVRIEDYLEDGTYVIRAELVGIDPARDVEVTLRSDGITASYADGLLEIRVPLPSDVAPRSTPIPVTT